MKEKLKKNQPVAYKILENSLKNQRLAHAYLFCGDAGCGKMNTAILLAQSILCGQDGFACEACETCQRVKENNYSDMIIVDGKNKSIKKPDILHIQEEFTKTALEIKGKKIYILNLVENATADALNSLLKFLEEPVSDVYAILITEKPEVILPTIVSRCQRIPFKKASVKECYDEAILDELDPLDAYLCANIVASQDEIVTLSEDENYQSARILAMDALSLFYDDPYQTILNIQTDGFNEKKGNDRIQFLYFVDIFMIFFKDVIMGSTHCENKKWNENMNQYSKKGCIEYLTICMKMKDKCNKSMNVKLLVDSMMIQMKEVS